MAIITSKKLIFPWMGGAPYSIKDEASSFYFSINSIYLSNPYELEIGDKIEAEILVIEELGEREPLYSLKPKEKREEEYLELQGKGIEFILYSLLEQDHLFISKKNWEEIREYGLVTAFNLSVRLEKAVKKDGTEVPLYTKRDVQI